MKKLTLLAFTIITKISFAQNYTVAVFCSADNKVNNSFKTTAYNLGTLLGNHNFGLVTGGSQTGLMKETIDGYVQTANSLQNLIGVMPDALKPYNVHHKQINEQNLLWVSDMHSRLTTFHSLSNALIILPGGFGTLHELLDFLVHCQFDLIKKIPIILFNANGYWDNLIKQLDVMEQENLLHAQHRAMITVVNSETECLRILLQLCANTDANDYGLNSGYWKSEKSL